MQASSARAGAPAPTRGTARWGAPIEATIAVLELIASEQPQFLEFQAHVLCNSTMSFVVQKLAAELGVSPEELVKTFGRACRDLDRLEKHRGRWQDPVKVLGSPNLAVLGYVCRARLSRVWKINRRRRLERIKRRVESAYKLAQTRVWIDDFIGPLPAKAAGGAR